MTSESAEQMTPTSELTNLNETVRAEGMMAGWDKSEPSLWPEPRTAFRAHSWSYARARERLDAAGVLISAEQAERRNLFLVNRAPGNDYATTRTLVSAYQMILPGEQARSHRHTPSALRFVLDVPRRVYTVVDGVRIDMRPGDVLLTPGWSWHGHANAGAAPGYWLDILDVPMVQLLEPMFLEWADALQDAASETRDSPFVLPWDKTLEQLQREAVTGGRQRLELETPSLKTFTLTMEALSDARPTPPQRTTASMICVGAAGSGVTTINGDSYHWSRGDVIAIPSWHLHSHQATEPNSVLFEVSDARALKALGLLRQASGS